MEIVLTEIGLSLLLAFVALVTFAFMHFFSYGLSSRSYDDALSELKEGGTNHQRSSSPKKKGNRKARLLKEQDDNNSEASADESSEKKPPPPNRKASLSGSKQQRFRRAESLKNEHVIFADEISADDEKHSPHQESSSYEPCLASILQNREEIPEVDPTGASGEVSRNSFEDIQPLDDVLLIRRKSVQTTPSGSGSLASSKHGSKTDLTALAAATANWENDQEGEEHHHAVAAVTRALKFADEEEPSSTMDAKRVCKVLRKMEMTGEEITSVMEVLLRKEEEEQQNSWVSSSPKKMSALALAKKEAAESRAQVEEASGLVASLQGKLKQLRGEFAEEKGSLARENQGLKDKMSKEEETRRKGNDERVAALEKEAQELRERLGSEVKENKELTQSVADQQGVIRAALKRIYPNMEVEDYCQEHQERLDKLVEKMVSEKKK